MKCVALYVRVSTQEQKLHGISVDNQIDALTKYAKEKGYIIVNIYNDAGISARKRYNKRPAILELLNDCKLGKIDLILFTKLDRWFRSVGDYYEVQNVLDANNVKWRAIWEDYETETSSGVFKVNIMLSVAQAEADRTSERIKATFDYKRSKGEYVGGSRPPIGYIRTGKKLIKDPETCDAMQTFFDTYLATFSPLKASESAREKGLIIHRDKASKIFNNPAYYEGGVNYVEGGAYCSATQWQAIQAHRQKYTRSGAYTYNYIFSGLGYCGLCGARLTSNNSVRTRKKTGDKVFHAYYSCVKHWHRDDCAGTTISEKALEKYLLEAITPALNKYNIEIAAKKKTVDYKNQIATCKAKLKRIKDLYELGDMDFTEYKEKRDDLKTQLDSYEIMPVKEPKKLPDNWRELYDMLDNEHKRSFWEKAIDHFVIHERGSTTCDIFF